jgi:hypothetical protein
VRGEIIGIVREGIEEVGVIILYYVCVCVRVCVCACVCVCVCVCVFSVIIYYILYTSFSILLLNVLKRLCKETH